MGLLGVVLALLLTGGTPVSAAPALGLESRTPVLSAAEPLTCDPATNPNCVCRGSVCSIVVPIKPPPSDPSPPAPPPVDPIGPGPGPGPEPGLPPPPPPLDPGECPGLPVGEICWIDDPAPPEDPDPDPGEPEPEPPPTQGEIIELIAQLGLDYPDIGSAPCSDPGCMGAVGLPVWLWTQPWQTYTDSVTIRGYTITLSAVPTQVTWHMGDGAVITCYTAGTPYDLSYDLAESPDCGHIYERQSADQPGQAYTLSAQMVYRVTWSGVVNGYTDHVLTSQVPIRIGEYQTVIVG